MTFDAVTEMKKIVDRLQERPDATSTALDVPGEGTYDYGPYAPAKFSDPQCTTTLTFVVNLIVNEALGDSTTTIVRHYFNAWSDSPCRNRTVHGKSGNGAAVKKKVPREAYWSEQAITAFRRNSDKDPTTFVKEHVVPYRVQREYFTAGLEAGFSLTQMTGLMESFPMAVITATEDDALKEYKRTMPSGWTDSGLYPHPGFARYLAADPAIDPADLVRLDSEIHKDILMSPAALARHDKKRAANVSL